MGDRVHRKRGFPIVTRSSASVTLHLAPSGRGSDLVQASPHWARRSGPRALGVEQGRDGRTVHRHRMKERKKTDNPREGWEDGTPPPHRNVVSRLPDRQISFSRSPGFEIRIADARSPGVFQITHTATTQCCLKKERKKTDNPREGWEDGTPPPHRDFKEGTVWCKKGLACKNSFEGRMDGVLGKKA